MPILKHFPVDTCLTSAVFAGSNLDVGDDAVAGGGAAAGGGDGVVLSRVASARFCLSSASSLSFYQGIQPPPLPVIPRVIS